MVKEKYVMICPKCKSIDVGIDHSDKFRGSYGLATMYCCYTCEFTSENFPEVSVSELEEGNSEISQKKDRKNIPKKKSGISRLIRDRKKLFYIYVFILISGLSVFLFSDMRYGLLIIITGMVIFWIINRKR